MLSRTGCHAAALVLCGLAGIVPVGPAAACTAVQRPAFFIDFAPGSASLAPAIAQSFRRYMLPHLSAGRSVISYFVLASGDIAEGKDWDAAGANARRADQELGKARIEGIRAMIAAQAPDVRPTTIETRLRENRQLFQETDGSKRPGLTVSSRAGIVATIRDAAEGRSARGPKPAC